MTQLDLKQLDRLERQASPAPWKSTTVESIAGGGLFGGDGTTVCDLFWDNESPEPIRRMRTERACDANGALIAESRNSLRALLDLTQELAWALVKDWLEYGCDCCHLDTKTHEWVEPQTCAACVALAKFRAAGGEIK